MDAQLTRSQGDGLSFQPGTVLPALRSNLNFWVTGIATPLFPALVRLHLPLVWPGDSLWDSLALWRNSHFLWRPTIRR
jgi:hypothetical protein